MVLAILKVCFTLKEACKTLALPESDGLRNLEFGGRISRVCRGNLDGNGGRCLVVKAAHLQMAHV